MIREAEPSIGEYLLESRPSSPKPWPIRQTVAFATYTFWAMSIVLMLLAYFVLPQLRDPAHLALYIAVIGALYVSITGGESNRLRRAEQLAEEKAKAAQRDSAQAQEYIERLTMLSQIIGSLGGTLVTDTVLEHLISSASVLSRADGFAVYLQTDNRLNLSLSVGLGDDFLLRAPPPLSDHHVDGEPIFLADLGADLRGTPFRAIGLQQRFQSMLELPMSTGGELIGVLSLFYARQPDLTAGRLEVLRIFAMQSAQALASARLYLEAIQAYQQRGERLLTLTWLSRTLSSSVDVESMSEQVIDVLLLASEGEIGLILLLEEYNQLEALQAVAQRGLNSKPSDTLQLAAYIRRVLGDRQQSVVIYRENSEAEFLSLSSHSQTILICPMIQGGLLFGVVWLESASGNAFNAETIQFIEQIIHQSLIVLENARLFQRIERDRNRLAALLDTMDEAMMMVDKQGRISIANPRIRMIGVEPEAIIGEQYTDVIRRVDVNLATRCGFDSLEEADAVLIDVQNGQFNYQPLEYTLPLPTGMRRIERKIVPIHNNDNDEIIGVMLVFYDRTMQYEVDRSREELTNMIVHDLRSPLMTITTSLKVIQTTVPKDAPYWPFLNETVETSNWAARKLTNRVNSILDIAKMRSGSIQLKREKTLLDALVRVVMRDFEMPAREMQVSCVYEADEPLWIDVDADKIERVLMNLVDNALKYTPTGGQVRIRACRAAQQGGQAFVQIEVLDEGPGVPEEYRARLFDRFFQVVDRQAQRGGVGLGLTFCKLVVDAHGGKIWVEDRMENGMRVRGSVFALTLPAFSGMMKEQ